MAAVAGPSPVTRHVALQSACTCRAAAAERPVRRGRERGRKEGRRRRGRRRAAGRAAGFRVPLGRGRCATAPWAGGSRTPRLPHPDAPPESQEASPRTPRAPPQPSTRFPKGGPPGKPGRGDQPRGAEQQDLRPSPGGLRRGRRGWPCEQVVRALEVKVAVMWVLIRVVKVTGRLRVPLSGSFLVVGGESVRNPRLPHHVGKLLQLSF